MVDKGQYMDYQYTGANTNWKSVIDAISSHAYEGKRTATAVDSAYDREMK